MDSFSFFLSRRHFLLLILQENPKECVLSFVISPHKIWSEGQPIQRKSVKNVCLRKFICYCYLLELYFTLSLFLSLLSFKNFTPIYFFVCYHFIILLLVRFDAFVLMEFVFVKCSMGFSKSIYQVNVCTYRAFHREYQSLWAIAGHQTKTQLY